PARSKVFSVVSIAFLARSDGDLNPPVFLTTDGVVGAIRICVGSDRLGFSPTASRYSRPGDARILNQPLFHRSSAVVGELHVVRVRAFAIGVAFDQHGRFTIIFGNLTNLAQTVGGCGTQAVFIEVEQDIGVQFDFDFVLGDFRLEILQHTLNSKGYAHDVLNLGVW